MAKVVTLPDGSTVEFPDDATPDAMQRGARNIAIRRGLVKADVGPALTARTAGEQLDDTDPIGRFLYGAAQTIEKPALALKQGVGKLTGGAVGGLTPQDVNALQTERGVSDHAGLFSLPTAGEVVGNVATMRGAPALAAKVGSAFPRALGMLRGPIVGGAASGAGVGALTGGAQPVLGDDESLLKNMLMGGLAGGVGGAAGGLVGKALGPGAITPTADARSLMDAGATPTVGQGAASSIPGMIEDYASRVPGVGRLIRSNQAKAFATSEDAAVKNAMGGNPEARAYLMHYGNPEAVQRAIQQTQELPERVSVDAALRDRFKTMADKMPASARDELNHIFDEHTRGLDSVNQLTFKTMMDKVGGLVDDLSESSAVGERRAARKLIDFRRGVQDTHPIYDELVELDDLLASVKTKGAAPKPSLSLGDAIVGLAGTTMFPKTSAAIAAGTYLGTTKTGARLAMGGTGLQKKLTELGIDRGGAAVGTGLGLQYKE